MAGCAATAAPQLAYPASAPSAASGPGALLCAGTGGGLAIAPLIGSYPGSAVPLRLATTGSHPAQPTAPFGLAGAGRVGRVVLYASSLGGRGRGALLTEGRATSRFRAPIGLGAPGSAVALGRAYLGDVAVAAARPGGGIVVRVQRWYAPSFGAPSVISTPPDPITSLVVTLDYRSDALVAWQQGGSIWARELRARDGRLLARQRVGPSAPAPLLQALVSDDNRAIVAWASTTAGAAGSHTDVRVAISSAPVRFGAPRAPLESYAGPPGSRPPGGSLALVRLSTEGVMLAWTGRDGAHSVVRAAGVGLGGVKPPTTLSDPSVDAALAGLATGPHADADALWTATPPASAPAGPARLLAARGQLTGGDRAQFGPPEPVAAGAGIGGAAIAIDPGSGGAIAAWRRGAAVLVARRTRDPLRAAGPALVRGPRAAVGAGAPSYVWGLLAVAVGALAAPTLALGNRRRRAGRALQ